MRPLDEALAEQQERFYARAGLSAFAGTVPFRLSTSRAMAALVATAALRFAASQGRARVHVVDVGAGTGRLGFHLLALGDPRVRVTLTDASAALVDAWRAHPQLELAHEQGRLAFFHARATALGPALATEPDEALVLCGTYLLDTLPHALLEAPNRRALVDARGRLRFANAELDAFSRATLARLSATPGGRPARVLLPVGGFEFLRATEAALHAPALLLLADKGSLTLEDSREPDPPRLARHGEGTSAWVNFDALRAWLGWRGWRVAPGSEPAFAIGATGLKGRVALEGLFDGVEHPLAAQRKVTALRHEGEAGSPGADWWERVASLPPDGDTLLELADALCTTPLPPDPLRPRLGDWLLTAVRTAFHLPADDVAFQAGRVLYRLGFAGGAAACFSHSLEQHGETTSARLNRALCLAQLGALEVARDDVALVLRAEPGHEGARRLLAQLEG
jgi:SAM-dependent methyltransferase